MASSSTCGQDGSTPAPPPPTPSNQTISNQNFPAADADVELSRFLNQLLLNQTAPSLSSPLPRFARKAPPPTPTPTPLISLIEPQHDRLISAASDLGYFHLTDHGIPSELPSRATEEFRSLSQSEIINNIHSPLGFSDDDDEDLVFDTCSTEAELVSFGAISEFSKSLEWLGLKVVELILSAASIDEPFNKGTIKPKCLIWISSSSSPREFANTDMIKEEEGGGGEMKKVRCFPYVVSLQYQMKTTKSWVMGESGEWVAVDPSPDSVLVTLGDIAQVWSNGRFKKVRGIPQYNPLSSKDSDNLQTISISMLVTLPMDSVVSPLPPLASDDAIIVGDIDEESELEGCQKIRFCQFPFEEYAWKVYHERFPFKDPLLRYRI